MSERTQINCKCGSKVGEYLGIVKSNKETMHLHKCVKCRIQIRIKTSEGMHYA